MEEEVKKVIKELNKLGIPVERIKVIKTSWKKLFRERAFPKVEIELFEKKY
jgi:hypothetical protein